jgi:phosphomannomutase/phosphoglucomutase
MILVVGLLCMAAAFILYRSNQRWLREQPAESAVAPVPVTEPEADAARVPEPVQQPEQPEQDADFVDLEQAVEAQAIADEAAEEEPRTAEEQPEPPFMRLHYDIAERRRQREAEHDPVELRPEIFRAYDIRGVIDKTLDSGVARNIGQAVGSLVLDRDAGPVVVARDGRLSGPYLMDGVIEGVLSSGCDVLDIGAVPTGVLYYAAFEKAAGSGIMITGSHNPPDYNGFKVMVGGDTLHGDAITGLYERIEAGDLKSGKGRLRREDVVQDYIERISSDVKVEKPLRIVIDCGNGIGGVCAADTLRALGVEVLPMFDEVDGTFPNHHPDPSEPENLQDLIDSVRVMDADLGLAFDGDADRLGVVTLAGNIIFPDRIMMLLALDVLDRVPGATILYDVKCTGHLPKVISEAGGKPVMYKTGHSLMKSKMKEVGSPFAGEMSGHFFFGERWYGVDDGIYAAARLLEILGGTETPPEAILNALPTSYSTPELKVQMEEGENHEFVEAFKAAAKFDGAEIHTIDGLRADWEDGWGLVRPSNTTPILVVRFDAETEEALERIKTVFRTQMLDLKSDLELPF